jgi:sugar phosphate isomerase/epimerase
MGPELSRIGIDFINVLGLPSVSYVGLATDLGCPYIGIGLVPITENQHHYPFCALLADIPLGRGLKSSLRDSDIHLPSGEGFLAHSDQSFDRYAKDSDILAELGVPQVDIVSLDLDFGGAYVEPASLVDMAEAHSLKTTFEFLPALAIGDLSGALSAIRRLGCSNFKFLFDFPHVFRSDNTVPFFADPLPSFIGHTKGCDMTMMSSGLEFVEKAYNEKLAPRKGELPLRDILWILPSDQTIGFEVPVQTRAERERDPGEQLVECTEATLTLIDSAERHRAATEDVRDSWHMTCDKDLLCRNGNGRNT